MMGYKGQLRVGRRDYGTAGRTSYPSVRLMVCIWAYDMHGSIIHEAHLAELLQRALALDVLRERGWFTELPPGAAGPGSGKGHGFEDCILESHRILKLHMHTTIEHLVIYTTKQHSRVSRDSSVAMGNIAAEYYSVK